MAIKRYTANKDNTITNAFEANLSTRGVSGNMGQSDIVEVFSIYAQASTSSSELSRILVEFPIDDVATDRTAGTIPASGSVSFYLRLYDAAHAQTTPRNFTLVTSPVSQSWQEGNGLDMENYSDKDESNWLYASDVKIGASASITIEHYQNDGILLTLSGGSTNYLFRSYTEGNPCTVNTDLPLNGWCMSDGNGIAAKNLATLINTSASVDFTATYFSASDNQTGFIYLTASSAYAGTTGNTFALSSSDTAAVSVTGSADGDGSDALFGGGSNYTSWTSDGGDYVTQYDTEQYFDTGFENLEVDISDIVEKWIADDLENYGFGVHLIGTEETAAVSYYTKMFFARGSQYFFKRPVLEARWDSSKKDNRDNFYLSSSLISADENLMKLYLYNVVHGELKNIPDVGEDKMLVSIYSGSSAPTGSALYLPYGGGATEENATIVTASFVETGIYSASFAYNSSSVTTIFDVWHSASIEYHTGSAVTVKTFDSQNYNINPHYVSKVINMKPIYSTNEVARFRLYVRDYDWQPNNYVVASNNIETSIIDNSYYKIARARDGLVVIDFGTGSLNHTRLSYDVSGSYFDLDISMLEKDYAYELSFSYLINGSYVEQSEKFRFNVE